MVQAGRMGFPPGQVLPRRRIEEGGHGCFSAGGTGGASRPEPGDPDGTADAGPEALHLGSRSGPAVGVPARSPVGRLRDHPPGQHGGGWGVDDRTGEADSRHRSTAHCGRRTGPGLVPEVPAGRLSEGRFRPAEEVCPRVLCGDLEEPYPARCDRRWEERLLHCLADRTAVARVSLAGAAVPLAGARVPPRARRCPDAQGDDGTRRQVRAAESPRVRPTTEESLAGGERETGRPPERFRPRRCGRRLSDHPGKPGSCDSVLSKSLRHLAQHAGHLRLAHGTGAGPVPGRMDPQGPGPSQARRPDRRRGA